MSTPSDSQEQLASPTPPPPAFRPHRPAPHAADSDSESPYYHPSPNTHPFANSFATFTSYADTASMSHIHPTTYPRSNANNRLSWTLLPEQTADPSQPNQQEPMQLHDAPFHSQFEQSHTTDHGHSLPTTAPRPATAATAATCAAAAGDTTGNRVWTRWRRRIKRAVHHQPTTVSKWHSHMPDVVGVPAETQKQAQALMTQSLRGRSANWAATVSGAAHRFAGFNWVRNGYEHARQKQRRTPSNRLSIGYWVDLLVHRPRLIVAEWIKSYKWILVGLIALEMLMDLTLVILYLAQMAHDRTEDREYLIGKGLYPSFIWTPRPYEYWVIACAFSLFNLVALITRTSFSEMPLRTLMHPLSIIDLFTTGPALVSVFIPNGRYLFLPYFLRCVHMIPRLRRLMHIRMEVSEVLVPADSLREKLVVQIATLACYVYVLACTFQYVEEATGAQDLAGVDAIYFAVVSMSTVGYGDLTAKSTEGRLVVILGLIIAFVAIPSIISAALETYRAHKAGGGVYESHRTPHVVLIGRFDNVSFVTSLLHSFFFNESAIPVRVVLLARHSLTAEVKTLISTPMFRDQVHFIRGSALNESDLIRAKVRTALAVFIITVHAPEEDERNVLRVWSVAKHAPDAEIYVHTHAPTYDRFVVQHATAVACAEDLKQALLGCNLMHPGAATLVTNLINNCKPLETYASPWLAQYGDGLGHEQYNFSVVPVFVGRRFHHIAAYLYCEFQVVAIAIRIPVFHRDVNFDTLDYHVVLNPAEDYVFRGNEEIVCIAQGLSELERIHNLTPETFERSLNGHPLVREALNTPCSARSTLDRSLDRPPTSTTSPPRAPRPGVHPNRFLARQPTLPVVTGGQFRMGCPDAPFTADPRKVPVCHLLFDPPLTPQEVEIGNASHHHSSSSAPPGIGHGPEQPAEQFVMEDHIVVVTERWQLFRFLCTLRSAHIPVEDLRPILFFSSELPSMDDFQYLAAFPMIRYLRGNPRRRRDLIRANIHMADRILILGPATDDPKGEDFADLQPILTRHITLHTLNKMGAPPVYTMVELNSTSAIQFLEASSMDINAAVRRSSGSIQGGPATPTSRASLSGDDERGPAAGKQRHGSASHIPVSRVRTLPAAGIGSPDTIVIERRSPLPSPHPSALDLHGPSGRTAHAPAGSPALSHHRRHVAFAESPTSPPPVPLLPPHLAVGRHSPSTASHPVTSHSPPPPPAIPISEAGVSSIESVYEPLMPQPHRATARDKGISISVPNFNSLTTDSLPASPYVPGVLTHDPTEMPPAVPDPVSEFMEEAGQGHATRRRTRRRRGSMHQSHAEDAVLEKVDGLKSQQDGPTPIWLAPDPVQRDDGVFGYHIGYPPPPRRFQRFYDPHFASGEAFVGDMLNTILLQHFFNPTVLDCARLFSGIRSRNDIRLNRELKVNMRFLYTEDMPEKHIGCTYKELFLDLCLNRGVVALGLYRAPCPELGNQQSFVWTAPVPDAVLKKDDVIFVLKVQESTNP
ncbi:hypothetical protein BCR44DRAFT_1034523 [Catenaria anguillulae PL171]|uniref:Calcium-activated potassium channel BK alpha subunit domain-containing protein n=1 Tax=Catenaria anguillulae PL171 TaxID=765915 RepID=A0A1Y2HUS5_9FUNG|nr:hypothetical protein BCR44DRAFT_1034523 [Catenaria anguillulae PL171]